MTVQGYAQLFAYMSRIAKPPQDNLPRIRKELKAYLKKVGSTPTAFAREHGVNQSTVQRFLAAGTKSVSPKIRPLLEYAGIDVDIRIDDAGSAGADNARIRQALDRVWDGQASTAEILARLIESVGPVIVRASHGSATRCWPDAAERPGIVSASAKTLHGVRSYTKIREWAKPTPTSSTS